MYADDLLLMSGFLRNLQLMIDICCSEITELDLVFTLINVKLYELAVNLMRQVARFTSGALSLIMLLS